MRKSSSIHRTISRGQRESVAYTILVPGVVTVVVGGPLKLERVSSGDGSPGLLTASVISVEPVADEAFCMSNSTLLSGNRMGGRSCLLYRGQSSTIAFGTWQLTDALALVLKMVGQTCKPTKDEYICCTVQQCQHPYTLLSSFYNRHMPR